MKKLLLFLAMLSSIHTMASKFKRHVIVSGIVLQETTLEPLKGAEIEVWLTDSLIVKHESDELGSFKISLSHVDTYDIVIHLSGFHSQHHEGLIIESLKVPSSLDIYMTSVKKEAKDIHCGERCWCINHEMHDWNKDTLGILRGKIIAKESKEPLPFVNVLVKKNGLIIRTGQSDFDGNFKIDSIPLDSCEFEIHSIGFMRLIIKKIVIKPAELWNVRVELKDFGSYQNFRCYSCCGGYIDWGEPTINLFAEEKERNEAEDAALPSTVYENSLVEPGIMAFPNPIIDMVTITELPSMDKFRIINHMGIEVAIIKTDHRPFVTIDLSFLKRGLYFIAYEEDGKRKLYGLVKE